MQPLEYAVKVYRFAGLQMSESMKNWITKSTKVSFIFNFAAPTPKLNDLLLLKFR